jgi:glycosyltransferase involved in cell wall biosynthesis
LRIGYVGRLHPTKNPIVLVQALGLLASHVNCELLIIGEGSERDRIESSIRSLGLSEKVRLSGFVQAPDELLTTCHIYAQPSLAEGFGIALVEAMSCGLPVIASAAGGMRELVENGRTGWLVAVPDPQSIADAIQKAWNLEPNKLAMMGQAARLWVEGRFDPAIYVREIEQLYDSLTP